MVHGPTRSARMASFCHICFWLYNFCGEYELPLPILQPLRPFMVKVPAVLSLGCKKYSVVSWELICSFRRQKSTTNGTVPKRTKSPEGAKFRGSLGSRGLGQPSLQVQLLELLLTAWWNRFNLFLRYPIYYPRYPWFLRWTRDGK